MATIFNMVLLLTLLVSFSATPAYSRFRLKDSIDDEMSRAFAILSPR